MNIKSSVYIISSPDHKQSPKPDRPEYAFIGRSNVGKSSLINMLCDNHKLAKTSGTPGKTQLINHFAITSTSRVTNSPSTGGGRGEAVWYLVDLPGYGYAKRSQSQRKEWTGMIEDYLRDRENLVTVFVLLDSRHTPQKIDIEFVNQLGQWQVPFCLVFTKADKEKETVVNRNVKAFLDELRKTWQFLPQHFVTSAIKKTGREEMLKFIETCNEEFANEAN